MKNILVMKFGGTSLQTAERIKNAAQIVVNEASKNNRIVVVVSAMGHTTDELIELSNKIDAMPNQRELDALLATGEQVSATLMAMALQALGAKAHSFNGAQARITTNGQFGDAKIEQINPRILLSCLDDGYIPVVAGFQGVTIAGDITTLGRGGSDTSAIALAAALKASRCDIYTDVAGVFSANPRVIPDALKLDEVSTAEMLALAKNGAQVLNARSVAMALERGVPVRVRSTFNPTDEGTLVSNKCSKNREFTGVAFNNDLNCIEFNLEKLELGPDRNLRSLQQARTQTKLRLLKLLSNAGISASIVSPCRPNPFKILLTVKKADTVTALATLHKATVSNREITVNTNLATIGLVSTKITTRHEVEALALMAANKIPVAALSMDQHLLTLLVPQAMADKGLKIIHSQFAGIFAAA